MCGASKLAQISTSLTAKRGTSGELPFGGLDVVLLGDPLSITSSFRCCTLERSSTKN